MNGRSEVEMYAPALEFLNSQPTTYAWRNGNHAVFDPRRQTFRKKAAHDRGAPDILGVKLKSSGRMQWGQAFAFEMKVPGGKLSEDQLTWLKRFAAKGGICFVVDSVDDIIECWKEI